MATVATNVATATTNTVLYVTNHVTVLTANVANGDITGLDVVTKINGLYSGMFGHFLVMLGIMATIVGVVIPVLLQRNQLREGRLQEQRFKEEFKAEMSAARTEFESKFSKLEAEKSNVEAKLKDAESRIEKKLAVAKGTIAHSESARNFDKGDYVTALKAAVHAFKEYVASGDELRNQNLVRAVNMMTSCVGKLTKQKIDENDLNSQITAFEESLKEVKSNKDLDAPTKRYFAEKEKILGQRQI